MKSSKRGLPVDQAKPISLCRNSPHEPGSLDAIHSLGPFSSNVEKRGAQAGQIISIRVDEQIDVLGGAHESCLNHGHAADHDIANRLPVRAPTKTNEIG